VADAVEEKEVGGLNGSDEHDPTTSSNHSQGDDAEDSDDIEDDISRSSQLEVFEHGKGVEHFGCVVGKDL